ncbi:hypothetical protein Tco_0666907 [Tanacetum coccineum]
MLQMPSTPNVNVPQLEAFDAVQGTNIGSGGLQNLADDVGCSKRRCIRKPISVLHGDSVLHLLQTLAGIDCPQMLQRPSVINVNVPQSESIPRVSTSNRVLFHMVPAIHKLQRHQLTVLSDQIPNRYLRAHHR